MGFKKGARKANIQRCQQMRAGKAAKADQENVPPDKVTEQKLKDANTRIRALEREAKTYGSKTKRLQKIIYNADRREERLRDAEEAHQKAVKEYEMKLVSAQKAADRRVKATSDEKAKDIAHLEKLLRAAEVKLTQMTAANETMAATSEKQVVSLRSVRRHVHCLQKTLRRAQAAHRRQKLKNGTLTRVDKMKARHAYDPVLRALVRSLVRAGCSQGKVGALLQEIGKTFGINLNHLVSRRTVSRIVLEGLIMARIQQGHEMRLAQDMTLSGDSTSRRNQNYQSHHVTYRVVEILPDGTERVSWRTRFLGIRSTVDHTAAKSKESWFRIFEEIISIYNASPLFARTCVSALSLGHLCKILRGMCSDHASAEKATADAMNAAKQDITLRGLGEERRAAMSAESFGALVDSWNAQKIDDAGGLPAWQALSKEQQAVRDLATVDALMRSLGEEHMSELPKADQRLLTLFVWTGCCMHKDQNSFKGGNAAMMAAWASKGLAPPILLANKANAEVVRKVVAPESGSGPLTEVEVAALEASTRGGAKTTALAGAIFNNHNDKKGQGDTHLNVMSYMLSPELDKLISSFPHTSNTRFGSHGEAAGELLVHLTQYIAFLEFIKLKKTKNVWTNIELNVYNALHDGPTLTELAVMALYQQLITHPYMRMVRAPESDELNAIDLGPLHVDVREHCQRLIDEPELILDFTGDCYVEAALDGQPFERPEVVDAIAQLVKEGRLEHLREMLVSFIEGANVTWLRFSSEYAPGGVISEMTEDERSHVFLNATNDRNEGALGSWCVWARIYATSTMHKHNALAMFERNDTQQFADQHFEAEDHLHVMRAARQYDASGVERQRRKEQAEFESEMVEMKKLRIAARDAKNKARNALLDATPEIQSEADARKLTGAQINLQFAKFKAMWGPQLTLPPGRSSMPVKQRREALIGVFRQHMGLVSEGAVRASRESDFEVVQITCEAWHGEEDEEMDNEGS